MSFAGFFGNHNRRPRGKHTVVETTTERRTPDGLLLSTSHSRNIFYGDDHYGMQHDVVATSPGTRRRHETPDMVRRQSPYRRPRSETIIREEMFSRTKEFSPERRRRRSPEVRNVPINRNFNTDDVRRSETRATFREDIDSRHDWRRNERTESRAAPPPKEEEIYIDPAQLYSNSTIYGDDWSARGSVCKQSHLVSPLVVDCALMREADLLIREICRDGELRSAHPSRRLSLWKGERLHSAIADLWTNHGPPTTSSSRFDPTRDDSLCVAGLSSGYAHEEKKFVVVAVFD